MFKMIRSMVPKAVFKAKETNMSPKRLKVAMHKHEVHTPVPSPAVSPVKEPDSIDQNTSVTQTHQIAKIDLKIDEVNDDVTTERRLTFDTGSDNTDKDDILTYHSNFYYRAKFDSWGREGFIGT